MPTFKITIAYDGTNYHGWQIQPDRPTIQDELEKALKRITSQDVRVAGSSRTDAGVHAFGQCASFTVETKLSAPAMHKALNALLPVDVSVVETSIERDDFHAIRDTVRKRYRYVLHDGRNKPLFQRAYCWKFHSRLDAEAMHRAGRGLVGTFDFRSFETNWPTRDSSVRTILDLEVRRAPHDPDLVWVEVEANGFLYNMVRTIVGTLTHVGRGRRPESWPAEVVAAQNRCSAGETAPPQGLFLLWVAYD